MKNSGLKRVDSVAYYSGKQQYLKSAKANLDVILRYCQVFKNIRGGEQTLANMRDIKKRVDVDNFLTDKQIAYIEATYEKVWSAIAKVKGDPQLTGISSRHDNKKTLRY